MASQVYFESGGTGDFYEATSTTNPGESPGTHPEKWTKIQIPSAWRTFLEERAVAYLLAPDQLDKARLMHRQADDSLMKAGARFVDRGDVWRSTVATRGR